jgi:hypothetical protein
MTDEVVKRRYFFCSQRDNTKHKGKHSAYMVEELTGSNVVARITPVGMVSSITEINDVSIYAISKGMSLSGEWQSTSRHKKVRAVIGRYEE